MGSLCFEQLWHGGILGGESHTPAGLFLHGVFDVRKVVPGDSIKLPPQEQHV